MGCLRRARFSAPRLAAKTSQISAVAPKPEHLFTLASLSLTKALSISFRGDLQYGSTIFPLAHGLSTRESSGPSASKFRVRWWHPDAVRARRLCQSEQYRIPRLFHVHNFFEADGAPVESTSNAFSDMHKALPALPHTPGGKSWVARYRDDPHPNDFSSTESTPNHHADTEDTPEPPGPHPSTLIDRIRSGNVAVARPGHERSRSKGGKRSSLWPWGKKPGVPSKDQQQLVVRHGTTVDERPSKRKRHESELGDAVTAAPVHDWDDPDSRPSSADSPTNARFPFPDPAHLPYGFFPAAPSPPRSVLNFLQAHPHLPDQLARWVQFGLSTLSALVVVGIAVGFLLFVHTEINNKAEAAVRVVRADIADCSKEWRDNGCAGPVGPVFQRQCDTWAECMARDAKKIGRASISASTMADILNAFFEPLSWKLLVRTSLVTVYVDIHAFPLPKAFGSPQRTRLTDTGLRPRARHRVVRPPRRHLQLHPRLDASAARGGRAAPVALPADALAGPAAHAVAPLPARRGSLFPTGLPLATRRRPVLPWRCLRLRRPGVAESEPAARRGARRESGAGPQPEADRVSMRMMGKGRPVASNVECEWK